MNGDVTISGTELKVSDFWEWAYADLLSNSNRGVLAEFLVASALEITDTRRVEWDSVDLRYHDLKIEVKASAYVQTWPQALGKRCDPTFGIRKIKVIWDAATNTYDTVPGGTRPSDVYVFCLFLSRDREAARREVAAATKWEFYVVETTTINAELGDQKTVGLNRLKALARPISYYGLMDAVDALRTR